MKFTLYYSSHIDYFCPRQVDFEKERFGGTRAASREPAQAIASEHPHAGLADTGDLEHRTRERRLGACGRARTPRAARLPCALEHREQLLVGRVVERVDQIAHLRKLAFQLVEPRLNPIFLRTREHAQASELLA